MRKVELERNRVYDVRSNKSGASSTSRVVEPISFTNIVHSPPSTSAPGKNAGAALIRRLFAAAVARLFKLRGAEKEPTLLGFTKRFNR